MIVENLTKTYNIIGMIGVVIILVSYLLLNMKKMSSDHVMYPILNACGSSMILFSLMFDWNLSSVIIEAAWASISIYGIYRTLRSRT